MRVVVFFHISNNGHLRESPKSVLKNHALKPRIKRPFLAGTIILPLPANGKANVSWKTGPPLSKLLRVLVPFRLGKVVCLKRVPITTGNATKAHKKMPVN